jgi:dTDP-4-dehydrorhamnose 3,5-epimerase-like enzyme
MSENTLKPYLINFDKIGINEIGYISVIEKSNKLPFNIERVYWTYYTPEEVIRGQHAHKKTRQILIAVSGKIIVETELKNGIKETFIIDKPNIGLYIPEQCWHTMQYSHSSVQVVLADSIYDEKDYIRNYELFIK